DSGFAGLEPCFANVLRRAEHFTHELWCDRYMLGFSARNLRCDAATKCADLSFELTDTGLMCVVVDNTSERVVFPDALFGFQSVFFELPRHEVPLGDLELLA